MLAAGIEARPPSLGRVRTTAEREIIKKDKNRAAMHFFKEKVDVFFSSFSS